MAQLDVVGGRDPCFADPRIGVRALLTGPHVPDARFVPGVAHLGGVTPRGSFWIVALEWLEVLCLTERDWIPNVLQRLPVGNQPHVIHRCDRVQEGDESFFVVSLYEPSSVVEESHWSPVGGVVPLEVLDEHFVDPFSVRWSGAGVGHGAATPIQVLPHHHRHLPHARV